ncbi:MAG: hypothetical protein ACI93T_002563, partial [Porticoccaceae bacterium]
TVALGIDPGSRKNVAVLAEGHIYGTRRSP